MLAMPGDYIITEKDHLYRRFPIVDEPRYTVFWKIKDGKKIPSSAAFKTKNDAHALIIGDTKLHC